MPRKRPRAPWIVIWVVQLVVASILVWSPAVRASSEPIRGDRAGTVVSTATESGCAAVAELYGDLQVEMDGCHLAAFVTWGTDLNLSTIGAIPKDAFNVTFALGGVGEIAPGGQVVRYSDLASSFVGTLTIVHSLGTTTFQENASVPVRNATGTWSLGTFMAPNTTVTQLGSAGEAGVSVGFTFPAVVNARSAASFVAVSGLQNGSGGGSGPALTGINSQIALSNWPWLSSKDQLGLWFKSPAAAGTQLNWNESALTLGESAGSNGSEVAQLSLAGLGTALWTSGPPTPAAVAASVGYLPSSASAALILLNLTTVNGGYSRLELNSSVNFNICCVPGLPGAGGGGSGPIGSVGGATPLLILGSVLIGAAASAALGAFAYRVRRTPPINRLAPQAGPICTQSG